MNEQFLQIADLFYSIPLSVNLAANYTPFICSSIENNPLASKVAIDSIKVADRRKCYQGSVIDSTKEVCIYKVGDDYSSYYVTLESKNKDELYELYASPVWDKITLSENCTSHACPSSVIDIFMMLIFIYSSLYHHVVLLHASCIKYGEQGIAFIGCSGAGKSTHSRLWLKYIPGTKLLNDDQPAVRVFENGKVVIYGTPWSGKTQCYLFDKATLRGIVRMKQAPNNKLISLSPVLLFKELLSSCSMIKSDPVTFKVITSILAKMVSSVSGFILENRPEESAVRLVYNHTLKKSY